MIHEKSVNPAGAAEARVHSSSDVKKDEPTAIHIKKDKPAPCRRRRRCKLGLSTSAASCPSPGGREAQGLKRICWRDGSKRAR